MKYIKSINELFKSPGYLNRISTPYSEVGDMQMSRFVEWTPQFNSKGEKIGELSSWRGPGHFRVCRATSYHRIELDPSVECWTLFMPGPQKREWGFLVKNKWVQHEEYLASRMIK